MVKRFNPKREFNLRGGAELSSKPCKVFGTLSVLLYSSQRRIFHVIAVVEDHFYTHCQSKDFSVIAHLLRDLKRRWRTGRIFVAYTKTVAP